MFIELTDHLRCPQDHDEAFLVLVPDRMAGRRVIAGRLGCPICDWSTVWDEGVPTFGDAPEPSAELPTFDAEAALALLGLDGPGGWVAFAGRTGALAHKFAELLPDVNLVAVNPPGDVESKGMVTVIRSATWPIKSHSMRGVVAGADSGNVVDAIASLLPGLRAAGEGEPPVLSGNDELVAAVPGAWLVRHA